MKEYTVAEHLIVAHPDGHSALYWNASFGLNYWMLGLHFYKSVSWCHDGTRLAIVEAYLSFYVLCFSFTLIFRMQFRPKNADEHPHFNARAADLAQVYDPHSIVNPFEDEQDDQRRNHRN